MALARDFFTSKTTLTGFGGILTGAGAAITAFQQHEWQAGMMGIGFAIHCLLKMFERDTDAKGYERVTASNLVVAEEVKSAQFTTAEELKRTQLAAAEQLRQQLALIGATGGGLSGGLGGQVADTFDFGSGVSLGGDTLNLGGGEVTRTLSWGDLPADGGGV